MGDDRDDAELQPQEAGPEEDRGADLGGLDALAGDSEADDVSPAGTHTALPPKIEAWRRRSAAGAILTGFALGLQEALETRKEEPSIVMETSGDPPRDLPVEADFEYGRPRQSVVQIRPWLLPESAAEQAPERPAGPDSGGQEEGGEQ